MHAPTVLLRARCLFAPTSMLSQKVPRIVGCWWVLVVLLSLGAIAPPSFAQAGGSGFTPGSSYPEAVGNIGGGFLFSAQDPQGHGLWRTDGTPAGTERLTLFGSLGVFSATSTPNFPVLGQYLYFTATTDATRGMQIWRTDGTAAGTNSFGHLGPDPNGSPLIFEQSIGTRLLFSAGDTQGNLQLYDLGSDIATTRGERPVGLNGNLVSPVYDGSEDRLWPMLRQISDSGGQKCRGQGRYVHFSRTLTVHSETSV
jgi:ELWxxDGT repeat protein